MNPGPAVMPATAHVHPLPAAERQRSRDDRWDQQLTRLLRVAAEARERRDRAHAIEDDRSARREAAAMLELIRAHDRPTVSQRRDRGS
jgi:hypothetical protein